MVKGEGARMSVTCFRLFYVFSRNHECCHHLTKNTAMTKIITTALRLRNQYKYDFRHPKQGTFAVSLSAVSPSNVAFAPLGSLLSTRLVLGSSPWLTLVGYCAGVGAGVGVWVVYVIVLVYGVCTLLCWCWYMGCLEAKSWYLVMCGARYDCVNPNPVLLSMVQGMYV